MKKLLKWGLIAVVAIVVIAAIAGAGGSGSSDADADNAVKGKHGSSAKGDVGNWQILTKSPEFTQQYGMYDTVKLRVKNVSDSEDEPWLEIRLTNKRGDLVATFDCIGDTVESGQTTNLECTSLDDPAKFSDYEIKNAF